MLQLDLNHFPNPTLPDFVSVPDRQHTLLRLRTVDGISIPPDEFMPLACENGYIVDWGQWILSTATATLLDWRNKGMVFSLLGQRTLHRHRT